MHRIADPATRALAVPTLGAFILGALFLVGPGSAQDWARFRGPAGAGLSDATTIPSTFALDEANWRVALPGGGHSSPVVWGGALFVTCHDAQSGERRVVALDVKDGKERWRHTAKFDEHGQHRLNSFASSTPVVDAERVYVVWTSGKELVALALDHAGEAVWRKTLGSFAAQHGSGASPVLAQGVLVVACDNEGDASYLLGLDAKTGETRWKRERKSVRASYATPLVLDTEAGPRVVFASTAHGLTCLDPKDGELAWEVDDLFQERCVGSPVLAGDILFTTTGKGGGGVESAALNLADKDDDGKPKLAYRVRRALPYVPTPVVHGEHLFLWNDGGILSCLESTTGKEVWRERTDGRFFGSPVCIDGRLFALSMAGELFVVRAAAKFELLGRVDLGEPSQATPAVAGGVMYLRTDSHLISVGGESQ